MNGIQKNHQLVRGKETSQYQRQERTKANMANGFDSEVKTNDKLSDEAKSLLKELQQKYRNMDIFVADYSSDAEAQKYLSRGTKQFSAVIEPELLERMAHDDKEKEKYLGIIDDATKKISEMKDKLEEAASKNPTGEGKIKSIGFSVSDDGKVDFFAELEKSSEAQRERIEKHREEQKAEKRAEKNNKPEAAQSKLNRRGDISGQAPQKVRSTFVQGKDPEELMKNIEKVDWNSIRTQKVWSENRFDFGV